MFFLINPEIKGLKMRKKLRFLVFFTLFILAFFTAYAENPSYSVVPWNGYKAAVSLTYDDGDPIHLDIVIPEMQKRQMRGTFFLIAGKLIRPDEWKAAAKAGMEIGNHTMTHRHVSEFSAGDETDEVDNAEAKLKVLSGQPVMTFAYPFVEITDSLRKHVEKNCMMARGGGPAEYYTPDSEPDWYNIHGQGTTTEYGFDTYKGWIDQDMDAGAWTIFLIHAIEGSNWYQPVPKDIFLKLLDYLDQNKTGIWIAPFGEVGAYWKAQKTIEAAKGSHRKGAFVVKWVKPEPFPDGVVVKMKVDGDGNTITQAGVKVENITPGVYPISFDAGELTIKPPKKNLKL
jgi:peptidoglycan/xylan/chitin deacetylase (PgdA/CDA1 family)